MKLRNSTDWPDWFLRRLVAWCCRELGVTGLREARFTKTRDAFCGRAWYGSRRILVRIGSDSREVRNVTYLLDGAPVSELVKTLRQHGLSVHDSVKRLNREGELVTPFGRLTQHVESRCVPCYPMTARYPGRKHAPTFTLHDVTEALLHVTAHEIAHHACWQDGHARHREARVDGMTLPLLEKFRANRDALLVTWNEAPAAKPQKPKLSRAERNEANARKKLAEWERKLKLARTKAANYRRKVRRYERIAARKGGAT